MGVTRSRFELFSCRFWLLRTPDVHVQPGDSKQHHRKVRDDEPVYRFHGCASVLEREP
jgi:hypothetical protein